MKMRLVFLIIALCLLAADLRAQVPSTPYLMNPQPPFPFAYGGAVTPPPTSSLASGTGASDCLASGTGASDCLAAQ